MLTKNEITALSLSPTKKDFVQIWNELLEVAGKLSERWDPTSTNESDPGIVILKALTGIADKLNYNIDKNTLEAFMPTAAQEDSMRKLCDMLGYTMKYYRSAETTVNIKYYNADPSEDEANTMAAGLYIPRFTVITNSDHDINYFTTNTSSLLISSAKSSVTEIPCMEGQLVKCESIGGNNVITVSQISENNRFYLPETQVAENGIFIYNVDSTNFDGANLIDSTEWTRVDNLNMQAHGTRVFKFGYDSYESRPYIEFPEDYSELFNEGLSIYYTRTNGATGNISTRTLTQLELPTTGGWSNVSAESFSVENVFSATSGANPETIKQAYNNFKKTIGTFETLVTCRDYMNKIYSMTSETTGKPLVSNILVTDIRNDLNKAITICSCDDAGIFYKDTPLTEVTVKSTPVNTKVKTEIKLTANMPVFNTSDSSWHLGSATGMKLAKTNMIVSPSASDFDATQDGTVFANQVEKYWFITQKGVDYKTNLLAFEPVEIPVKTTIDVKSEQPAITHFDLVFYPFKSYNQIKSSVKDIKAVYDASFTYTNNRLGDINSILDGEGIKTISHSIKSPKKGDLLSINNYLRLSATIATNAKVTEIERSVIVDNIKIALANAFNMRELDFGDEIPFDSLVEVIEGADARIRVASLNEPALYTTFSVLEDDSNNKLNIVEYAVASDWLDVDMANATGRLTKEIIDVDVHGKPVTKTVSTFNTKEAKQIYNKLAVRNVLAGRVPLFNYNTTFKSNFSEGAYQVTNIINENPAPGKLEEPTPEVPFTVFTDNGITYTGQLVYKNNTDSTNPDTPNNPDTPDNPNNPGDNGSAGSGDDSGTYNIIYTETKTPDEYNDIIKDNVIKENVENTGSSNAGSKPGTGSSDAGNDNNLNNDNGIVSDYITDISTSCKLFADEGTDTITDITLAEGEFVKFRAPNFTTVKTYPAYVNYHLDLATNLKASASPAEADALFNILNSDRGTWATSDKINWQKVLDYFGNLDAISGTKYKKTFTLAQTVSAYTNVGDKPQTSDIKIIGITATNNSSTGSDYTVESLVNLSGCVKLANKDFKARVEWTPADGESAPGGAVGVTIDVSSMGNPFITDVNELHSLMSQVDNFITTYSSSTNETGESILPRTCSWTVYFDFECVPFEVKSLAAWEKFVSACALDRGSQYQVFDFKPVAENNVYLWRSTEDNSYEIGKYVTVDSNKLLKFSKNYFNSLPNIPLTGIYIIKNIGANAEPTAIKNGEEYRLRQNERLYIEYTPSTTTEDTGAKSQSAITEVYGEGTIIRPNGFDAGVMDSSVYASMGNTAPKMVTFAQVSNTPINMFSLGASEQLEVRDLAKVELSKTSFGGNSELYVYKNFNNCAELEEKVTNTNGERINNTYTLKDGEYIFYTDLNKTDFAYYTSGTQVILSGELTLPEFDVIELSTIFDSGLQEIPWARKALATNDKLTFQEFQYITLGPGDTIKNIALVSSDTESATPGTDNRRYLDENWQYCDDVSYIVANAPDNQIALSDINIPERLGCGWEACSTLELDVTANSAQTLRKTDKVETSIILSYTSTTGGKSGTYEIIPATSMSNTEAETSLPISFKTNVACQASGNSININDIYYNPDDANGFQLKVFVADTPSIVTTLPNTVAPYTTSGLMDIATWTGEPLATESSAGTELWNQIAINKVQVGAAGATFDNALRLSISLLQDTYGVFCVYVSNLNSAKDNIVWLEVMPGTRSNAITLLNTDERTGLDENNRLYLKNGINCVRVNETCKLFMKALRDTDGTIYFDEPKLVNCKKLEYKNSTDTEPVAMYTSGLNLTQLGYLDTSSEEASMLDKDAVAKLKTAYVDKATNALNTIKQAVNTEISDRYTDLAAVSKKVQVLVNAEKLIEEELANIANIEDKQLAVLIEQYTNIKATLESEYELLAALKNNTKAEDLEQKLVTLLDSISTTSATQQQILDNLATIKAKANTALETLSESDILADYTVAAVADDFDEIRKVAADNIEKNYQEQLAILVDSLEHVTSSEDMASLTAILTKLRAIELFDTQAELKMLVNRLNDTLEQDTISDVITEMADAAASADYTRLYSLATTLSTLLESKGLAAIAAELSQLVAEFDDSDSEQLTGLVQELNETVKAIGGESSNTGLYGTLNSILTAVQTNINDGKAEVDENIINAIVNLKNDYTNAFKAELQKIVGQNGTNASGLLGCVAKLANEKSSVKDLMNILKALDDSSDAAKNSQVSLIVAEIKSTIAQRSNYLEMLSKASYNNWQTDITRFVQTAIAAIWPANILSRLTALLATIDSEFSSAINSKLDNFNATKIDTVLSSSASNTNVLLNIVNVKAIKALYASIRTLLSANEQDNANKQLIAAIGGIVQSSSALVNADSQNAVLKTIIQDWQASTDIVEKQRLQSSLKDTLSGAIAVDEQLAAIIVDLLWPNIKKLETELDTKDDFYKKLFDRIIDVKDAILKQTAVTIIIDTAYNELLKQTLTDFKTSLLSFKPQDSLLPADLVNEIASIKTVLEAITNDTDKLSNIDLATIADYTEEQITELYNNILRDDIEEALKALRNELMVLGNTSVIQPGYEDVFHVLRLEDQLLAEIRSLDVNNEFYYSVPVEDRLAIEFNESDKKLNTLMNPLMNYDINNVNNRFVISKLDIDYLNSGIQVARSSRLN